MTQLTQHTVEEMHMSLKNFTIYTDSYMIFIEQTGKVNETALHILMNTTLIIRM